MDGSLFVCWVKYYFCQIFSGALLPEGQCHRNRNERVKMFRIVQAQEDEN